MTIIVESRNLWGKQTCFSHQIRPFMVMTKLEMLGSIVSRLASPRKILGKIFFEHSR